MRNSARQVSFVSIFYLFQNTLKSGKVQSTALKVGSCPSDDISDQIFYLSFSV